MLQFFTAVSGTSSELTPEVEYLTYQVIGDSISRGTSNGVGDADSEALYEWNGSAYTEVSDDVSNANTGSWMPEFANKMKELTGKRVIVSASGEGGSEFHPYLDDKNWSTSGNLYAPMKTKADGLVSETGSSLDGFIVILGINDARGNSLIADIETSAISLITRLNTDFSTPPIYIVQIGREESGVTQRVLDVRDIISNGVDGLVETYSNVKLCASLADNDNTDFYDDLHLNQAANDALGEEIAIFINEE